MTDDNKKKNIADELLRSEQCLRAARALLDLALYADAVSRAYYAVFHALRAALLTRGVEPKTHTGAIHLFNTELVRTGDFSSAHNRLIGGLQRSRELADYDAAVVFSEADARAEIDDAVQFIDEARAYLARTGPGAG